MPVHRWDGSSWIRHTGYVANAGTFSDGGDNLWAWDGTAWQLIQPVVPVGTGLLPPIDLSVDFLDDHAVEITWANPDQPGPDPTDVQYRIPEITSVLTELPYPINIFNHEGLQELTAYTFEVRYIIRELGEVTLASEFASIPFVTEQQPVSEPGPDPGGGPGGGVITVKPLPDPDNCNYAWTLEVYNPTSQTWIPTGFSGTHPGDQEDFHYDLATLDPTRVYRFEFCEVCFGTPTGECNYGPQFNGLADWEADCGGIPGSSSGALAPTADAIWQMPHICTDAIGERIALFDGVSGTELHQGSNMAAWFHDSAGEHAVVCDTEGGNVFGADLAIIETAIQTGDDFTIMYGWRNPDILPEVGSHIQVFIGSAHSIQIVVTPSGWSAKASFVKAGGGTIELVGTEHPHDTARHHALLRWDSDGTKGLWVDGVEEDTDVTGIGVMTGTQQTYSCSLLGAQETFKHYGWARLLTDAEIRLMTGGVLLTDIPNLQWWLDAADVSTLSFSSADNVSQIRDKSGQGRHSTPGTSIGPYHSDPAYLQNGRRKLRKLDTGMGTFPKTNGLNMPVGNREYTFFMMAPDENQNTAKFVCAPIVNQDHQGVVLARTNATTVALTIGDGATYLNAGDTRQHDYQLPAMPVVGADKPRLITVRVSAALQRMNMHVDGVDLGDGVLAANTMPIANFWATSTAPNATSQGWFRRQHSTGANESLGQDFMECAQFDRYLTDAEVDVVEQYLINKWAAFAPIGVTISPHPDDSSPTHIAPVRFAVHFDEAVTGFGTSSVTVGGTANPNPTYTLVSGSGADYTVSVQGMTTEGTVTCLVKAAAAVNSVGAINNVTFPVTVDYQALNNTPWFDDFNRPDRYAPIAQYGLDSLGANWEMNVGAQANPWRVLSNRMYWPAGGSPGTTRHAWARHPYTGPNLSVEFDLVALLGTNIVLWTWIRANAAIDTGYRLMIDCTGSPVARDMMFTVHSFVGGVATEIGTYTLINGGSNGSSPPPYRIRFKAIGSQITVDKGPAGGAVNTQLLTVSNSAVALGSGVSFMGYTNTNNNPMQIDNVAIHDS